MKTILKSNTFVQIKYDDVTIESNTLDCNAAIINTFIREKYSVSQVEAIVNNYLLDDTNKEYLKEFNDMQEWRKQAKSIAKEIITFIKDNDLANKPDGIYEIKD